MHRIALISQNTFFTHAFMAAMDFEHIEVKVHACSVSELRMRHPEKQLDLAVFELAELNDRFVSELLKLHHQRPKLKSLLILPSINLDVMERAFRTGCVGCLPSNVPIEAVTQYLMLASQGQRILPDDAVDMLQKLTKQKAPTTTAEALRSKLTYREQNVLSQLLTGQQNKQIAMCLDLPLTTVKGDLKSIMRKTGAQNRTALAIAAVKTGWTEPKLYM
ncbi:response regulator transcription factor [Thalassobius sp. Cn5-15]|uniref:helix-turn-helix transcriptional regulator n=1 Tax=Thalassobius sp. Cn5-15 TaxID=2917763 RepID=UPI001EF24D3D|nr:response regulator transcription factor [Thalassobius sp. Cn5-15]MCG7491966.1 response regulator transcription factor [Thalassobius sp. Cn5-15]